MSEKSQKALMAKLLKLEGVVDHSYNPYLDGIRSSSPSLNFTFGNTHLLPFGYTLVMYGLYKSGKTLITTDMIGRLHKDNPEAVAIRFNTEFREQGQLTPKQFEVYGIDKSRYICYEVNHPALIFDRIETDIAAQCQEGLPVKFIIIDSTTNILGRRFSNADSVDVQQIGDHAATIGDGLKRILPVIRKHKIALVLTAQARAEMDPLEIKRGNKYKMAAANALQHMAEYFMYVESDKTKDGRSDLLGKEFVNENLLDLNENAKKTGHKIRMWMKESSMGSRGRMGEFTLDYDGGIINTHEEIFLLGVNRGIITRPNNLTYTFNDLKWAGKPAILESLKENQELQAQILKEVRGLDASRVL